MPLGYGHPIPSPRAPDGRTDRLRSLLSLSPLFCRRHRRRRLESPVKRLHIVKRVILRYRSCKKHTESQFGKGRRGGRADSKSDRSRRLLRHLVYAKLISLRDKSF